MLLHLEQFLGHSPYMAALGVTGYLVLRRYSSLPSRVGGWLIAALPTLALAGVLTDPVSSGGEDLKWILICSVVGLALGAIAALRANRKGTFRLRLI